MFGSFYRDYLCWIEVFGFLKIFASVLVSHTLAAYKVHYCDESRALEFPIKQWTKTTCLERRPVLKSKKSPKGILYCQDLNIRAYPALLRLWLGNLGWASIPLNRNQLQGSDSSKLQQFYYLLAWFYQLVLYLLNTTLTSLHLLENLSSSMHDNNKKAVILYNVASACLPNDFAPLKTELIIDHIQEPTLDRSISRWSDPGSH
jgi:hypothetical protein